MGKGISRPKALPAAGYTTRRYVKLLRRIVDAPFFVSPARSSRRQEGVLLQGLARRKTPHFVGPRPQSAVPHWRCTGARVVSRWGSRCCASILPPPRTPALDKEVVHVRCAPVGNSLVVAPVLGRSAAKDQAVGRAASLVFVVSTPRYGFAVFIYTYPLFLHTSAVVNHAGSVPGVQGAAVRNCSIVSGCWRRECRGQRFRRIVAAKTDSLVGTQSRLRFCPSSTAPVGIVFPGLRPRALSLRFSVATGRAGPDPGGRLCPQAAGLCRRPGAWGLPSVVPSKPVIPHAQMLQTASGATLHSLCSFRAIGGL